MAAVLQAQQRTIAHGLLHGDLNRLPPNLASSAVDLRKPIIAALKLLEYARNSPEHVASLETPKGVAALQVCWWSRKPGTWMQAACMHTASKAMRPSPAIPACCSANLCSLGVSSSRSACDAQRTVCSCGLACSPTECRTHGGPVPRLHGQWPMHLHPRPIATWRLAEHAEPAQ